MVPQAEHKRREIRFMSQWGGCSGRPDLLLHGHADPRSWNRSIVLLGKSQALGVKALKRTPERFALGSKSEELTMSICFPLCPRIRILPDEVALRIYAISGHLSTKRKRPIALRLWLSTNGSTMGFSRLRAR